MSETSKCPVCGGDPNADMTDVKKRVHAIGLTGEMVDPGGRALTFSDGRRLRLTDCCNACDAATIIEFLDGMKA